MINIIDVTSWYALGLVSFFAFLFIIVMYYKKDEAEAIPIILAVALFYTLLDFFVEYFGIKEAEWGYPESMYHIYTVPIEMIFISLGSGAIIGAIIWELWPKRGKPVKWTNAIFIPWGIFGFTLLYIFDIEVNLVVWVLMPLAIWGTITIMYYKKGLMPYIALIGVIAMILDGIGEWYFTIYNSNYWWEGTYDFWHVAPAYFLLAIIGGGIVAYILGHADNEDEDD